MARIVKLQLNTSGAWRNLIDFDLDALNELDQARVLDSAGEMVAAAYRGRLVSMRVIPSDPAVGISPLMRWTPDGGWQEIQHRHP